MDENLSQLINFTQNGWPQELDSKIKPYYHIKDSILVESNCILYGNRIIILNSLSKNILQILHTGHFRKGRMKSLARTALYWTGVDLEIEDVCKKCNQCALYRNLP